jgi:murein DD-endopeptidase MepM/ murein hydrolase activator NlpD
MKRAALIGVVLALSGCIPPSAPNSASDSQSETDRDIPRIEAEQEVFGDQQPVWDAQPVTANARSVDGGRYIVQPGDTLRSIGAKTGVGSETLARVNNLGAPFILHPGDVLTIPAGRFHSVAAGETGIAIARAYTVPWGDIVAANALEEPFTLRVGQRLIIPGEIRPPDIVPPSEQTLEARAAAFKLDIEDVISGGEPAVAASAAVPPVAEPARFAGAFAWPAAGNIASSFGPKSEGTVNQGIELAVTPAAPILASADGVVAFVGNNVAPVGGLILIRHGGGWITAYGHAASAGVLRGQTVKRGQVLGKAGTGSAPLLFFQMRKNGVPVDPVKNLPVR